MSSSAGGGTITLLAGAVLLRLTLTGTYQRYVKVGMGPWLTIAGVALVALGLATLVRSFRRPATSHDEHGHDEHDHDDHHDHSDNVGWLLLAPIAALLLVAPPTLGSYGVDRGATVDVTAGAPAFDDLEAGGEPVPMTLLEYSQRAFDHGGETFAGASVQLTGFVVDGGGGQGFRLARYQIACCAVDAAPVIVRVVGTTGDIPRRDQWVTVTGTYSATDEPTGDDDEIPALSATTVMAIEPPEDPYE